VLENVLNHMGLAKLVETIRLFQLQPEMLLDNLWALDSNVLVLEIMEDVESVPCSESCGKLHRQGF
jgi:hypothetical protein